MPPRPSHKRSAGSAGAGDHGGRKKTRFVEPGEDPARFADEVDAQLETANRKGRVRTDGYDSDSSDDGEGVVESRKAARSGGGGAEDDDDDMFAIGETDDKAKQGGESSSSGAKKKKDEYLRLGDIEGQEFAGDGGDGDGDGSGEASDSEPESDAPEDEDDAARRAKAGMGFELSSFNMREEMEEGKFAADGTYVRTFDPHAAHDRWMEDVDERAIKRARRSHKHQARVQREKMKAEERELAQLGGRDALERELVGMLKKGESVLEALQRLGAQAKKSATGGAARKRPGNRKREGEGALGEGDAMAVDKTPKAPSAIDHITHIASTLMSLGDTDVYSKTYEELVRSVRAAGNVEPTWVPPSADVKYEYKWAVPGAQDDQVFGPFTEDEMRSWHKAAYFGAAGEKVQVRPVGGEWGAWGDALS